MSKTAALPTSAPSERTPDAVERPAGHGVTDVAPRPWSLLRSAPAAVWALVVLNGLFLVCWSILTPTYHAPDEPNHVDAAVRLYEGLGWPPPSQDVYMTPNGLSSWVASPYGRPTSPLTQRSSDILSSDATPRDQRPPWKDLRAEYPPPKNNPVQLQQMVQHPPLYYAIDAAALKVLPGADTMRWDIWVGIFRLISVALVTLLPLILWATAVAFHGDERAGLVAALVPFAIPQLSHITSVVNNDSAVILFASLSLCAMVCVLRGNTTRSNAVFLGVVTGLALLSKSLSLVLVPMIVAAYLLRDRPDGSSREPLVARLRSALRPRVLLRTNALLALVVAFVCGGWWYAFQLERTGSIQPQIPEFPGGFRVDGRVEFFDNAWRLLVQRYWASVGWYEVNIPFRYALLATMFVVGLGVFALLRARPMRRRRQMLLLLFPTAAILVLVVANSYGFYSDYGRVLGLQGRYLFLGIGGVAVLLAGATAALPMRARRFAPLAIAVFAVLMQGETIRLVIDNWWTPSDGGLRQAWGALSAHAIWSPLFIQLVVASTIVAALVTAVGLVRSTRAEVD